MRSVHKEQNGREYNCDLCTFTTSYRTNFERHSKRAHKGKAKAITRLTQKQNVKDKILEPLETETNDTRNNETNITFIDTSALNYGEATTHPSNENSVNIKKGLPITMRMLKQIKEVSRTT